MAYRVSQDESFHSLSMLNGVTVKISEKFIAPAKIVLPNDWKPSDPTLLLSFQYDFSKEKHAIRLADEEKLIQEQQAIEGVERLLQNQDTVEPVTENSNETQETSTERVDPSDEHEEETLYTNLGVQIEPVNEILTPFVIQPASNIKVSGSSMGTHQAIDLEEFEGTNQNPFELVELQTLNELDELRSVLEPGEHFKKRNKKKPVTEELNVENEVDFSIFNKVPEQTVSQPADVTVDKLIDTEAGVVTNAALSSEMFNFPNTIAHGTLRWTRFEEAPNFRTNNPFQPFTAEPVNLQLNCNMPAQNGYLSKSPPGTSMQYAPCNGGGWDTEKQLGENKTVNNEMTGSLTRTKSLPNLQEQDYENLEITSNRHRTKSGEFNELGNPLNGQNPQSFPTNRIENIMKQYQFQRFSETTDRNIPSAMQPSNAGPVSPSTASLPVCTTQSLGNTGDFMNYNSNNSQTFVSPQSMFTTSMIPSVSSESVVGRYNPPYMNNTNPFSIGQNYIPMSNMNLVSNNAGVYNASGPRNQVPTAVFSGYDSLPSLSNYHKPYNDQLHSGPTLIQSRSSNTTPNVISLNPITTMQGNTDYENALFYYKPTVQVQSVYSTNYLNGNNALQEPVHPNNNFGSTMNHTPLSPMNHQTNLVMPKPTGRSANMDGNLKQSTSQNIPSVTPAVSWLQDQTNALSTNEKNFAYQLTAMGFPLPCVSRTIKRLGIDEPKVLDFLCLVQELKEKGYDTDDIEMALVNRENNREQVITYLDMVSTFKELGFEPQKIHTAMQETSCDQHKTLDYLTR